MNTYGFRIRFILPENQRISYENIKDVILLPYKKSTFFIRGSKLDIPENGPKEKRSRFFDLFGTNFSSRNSAVEAGRRIIKALLVTCAIENIGIDLGSDEVEIPDEIEGEREKKVAEVEGYRLLDNFHGLTVYREDLPISFKIALTWTGVKSKPIATLAKMIVDFYDINLEMTKKQQLAFELFNYTNFEESEKVRFINLITVIEVLSERDDVAKDESELLDYLIMYGKESQFKQHTIDSIVSRLYYLKKDSVSKACRKLIKKHIKTEEAVKKFTELYSIRGSLLHSGSLPSKLETDFEEFSNRLSYLGILVRDILVAEIGLPKKVLWGDTSSISQGHI